MHTPANTWTACRSTPPGFFTIIAVPIDREFSMSQIISAEAMTLTIKYAPAPLGHELAGIDLRTIDERTFDALNDAYMKYGVIVVRGQTLSPRELVDFSARFGKLLEYPLGNYLLEGFPEI